MKILTTIPSYSVSTSCVIGDELLVSHAYSAELIKQNHEVHSLSYSLDDDEDINEILQNAQGTTNEELKQVKFMTDINEIDNDYDFYLCCAESYQCELDELGVNYCKSKKNKLVYVGWGRDVPFLDFKNAEIIHYIHITKITGVNDVSNYIKDVGFTEIQRVPLIQPRYNPIYNNIIIGTVFPKYSEDYGDPDQHRKNLYRTLKHFEVNHPDIIFDFTWMETVHIDRALVGFLTKNEEVEVRNNIRFLRFLPYASWLRYLSRSIGYIHPIDRDCVSYVCMEPPYLGVPILYSGHSFLDPFQTFPTMLEKNDHLIAIDLIEKMIEYSYWYKTQMSLSSENRDALLTNNMNLSEYVELNYKPDIPNLTMDGGLGDHKFFPDTFDEFKRLQIYFQKIVNKVTDSFPSKISETMNIIRKKL